jgi:5'-nucleotidase / UDP-sugar diphosphatase
MTRQFFRRTARSAARALIWGGATFGAAAVAASSPACSASTQSSIATSPCPLGESCQARLTLLHTADIHSRLLPYDLLITQVDANLGLGAPNELKNVGGVARMAYILGRERARASRALHLSGGDTFQGAPIFNYFQGEPEMRAASAMNIDAMSIANHEFDLGPLNVARQIQKWGNFQVLAANYKFDPVDRPSNSLISTVVRPFSVFTLDGLKIAVIGMGNLSSLSSLLEQPNKLGIQPLATVDTAQFYVDLVRPYVDVVVFTTHLGLDVDQRMIRNTTGIDVVLGSHNHIVLNPPQTVQDCSSDPTNPGFIWQTDATAVDPNAEPPRDAPGTPNDKARFDPLGHPWKCKRACRPRNVLLVHSGAFAKYVGRLDLILSNNDVEAAPLAGGDIDPAITCNGGSPPGYDPVNKFEVISSKYVPFPVDSSSPEDPIVARLLEPYRRNLDLVADLDVLVGFSPSGSRRISSGGGDSPLGNLVANSMWLRLGVQTDFSLTNSAGIRTDLLPGPITLEQMFNIFPFDNTVTKMQVSGGEIQEMFDFVARRSANRGCTSQVQIAGARVRLDCAGCQRPGARPACKQDSDCPTTDPGSCEQATGLCIVGACAEQIYIGTTDKTCTSDDDCPDAAGAPQPGACSKRDDGKSGRCMTPVAKTNVYELATSNYIAAGGSGFRVLQRNTTQIDTKIQQRDALTDFMRQGRPCGYRKEAGTSEGLVACETDTDCASEGDFVCACPGRSFGTEGANGALTCATQGACSKAKGRCVRRDCRDQVASFNAKRCKTSKDAESCRQSLGPCTIGGESCKFLACVDETLGSFTDNRIEMIGR